MPERENVEGSVAEANGKVRRSGVGLIPSFATGRKTVQTASGESERGLASVGGVEAVAVLDGLSSERNERRAERGE